MYDCAGLARHDADAPGQERQRTLARGFALIGDLRGTPVTAAKALKTGDDLTIRFYDGTVDAMVTGKEQK